MILGENSIIIIIISLYNDELKRFKSKYSFKKNKNKNK